MSFEANKCWTKLRPPFASKASSAAFAELARKLSRSRKEEEAEDAIEEVRGAFLASLRSCKRADRQVLICAGLVLSDLAIQGWQLRVRRDVVEILAPAQVSNDRVAEKARIRRQELVKRNAQLRQAAVQKFVRSMEQSRFVNGKFSSIFSLMRDGRELAEDLRKARQHINNGWADALANAVDPYLEFVTDNATCRFTGLRLVDIWRYFRHTWTNQYSSVPGRTMMFLVRDRRAPWHPVVGIGALSSPVMQIRERDLWIGWHPDVFMNRVQTTPTLQLANWLVETIDAAIAEIYVDDLQEDLVINAKDLRKPTDSVIQKLLKEGATQRRLHHRFARSSDHKSSRTLGSGDEHWIARARTHLFRSKRSLALASYLRVRATLRCAFGKHPTAEKLAALSLTESGRDAIRTVLRKAKADRVGIAVADISVCGAIQPYNAILGGKLVAMLATSPEVISAYHRRYSSAQSEIASSIAGRPIVRSATLVLLGTTSLYGSGSSQYNRIRIPCDRLGGAAGEEIRYQELGHSEAFGTSQYSDETVDALVELAQQSANGQRVNSIFGEGVSPKLRKVRQGLDLLGLPSNLLLRHHRRRIVYGASLVQNLESYLLGLERQPSYLVPLQESVLTTGKVAAWWRERWLRNRIMSDAVLEEVGRHTLVRPISHGARVVIPTRSDEQVRFAEFFLD